MTALVSTTYLRCGSTFPQHICSLSHTPLRAASLAASAALAASLTALRSRSSGVPSTCCLIRRTSGGGATFSAAVDQG
jgi:hypothetical protein